jgi:tRNA(Ile)-lysidine synthase
MPSTLKRNVLKTVADNELLPKGGAVVVAVSGGPDSVALLHILHSLKDQLKTCLVAAHLNHMIRGAAANNDERYVAALCKKLGIELRTERVDVPKRAKAEKLSLEDAARRCRYEFLEGVAEERGAAKIAVGHTVDDNIETVLMRLVVGTGTRGLLGIPVSRGKIIRPLLNATRADTHSYCREHRLKPRIDESNFDVKYLRNRIRHKLIPVLKSINPNFMQAIRQATEILAKDYDYLAWISLKALHGARIGSEKGSVRLDADKVLMYPDSIKRYVIREAIEEVKGDLENIAFGHIKDIMSKIGAEKKWRLSLPGGMIAGGNADFLEISRAKPESEKTSPFNYKLTVPGEVVVVEAGLRLKAAISAVPKNLRTKNRARVLVDLNKTGSVLHVRSRKIGDRFSPLGIRAAKKLKDFLINEKVPLEKRDLIPIVESRGKIVWVAGRRIDERFKITGTSKKALVLSLERI